MFSKNFLKDYVYPIAVFSGGMIGVGFLSLPYIAMKTGIWPMVAYFLAVTAIIVIINRIFCEISLKTPDFKRFPGFVGHYLGKWGWFYAMVSTIFAVFGVLLAYIIVGSQFMSSVFQPIFHGSPLTYVFIYWLIASIIIYFDIKIIAKVELWVLLFLFISLFFVLIESFSKVKLSNIFVSDFGSVASNLFLPYGPLLFALWGTGLIPEVEEMLMKTKKNLKGIITFSTIIISIFYFLFVLLILGIAGSQTDPTALQSLNNFLPANLISICLFMGMLATFAAFITQGIIFKKTLLFDLKIKHWQAFVITCCPPMILFLLGLKSFIPLLSFVGAVVLGINGILILLMYKKIGGKSILIYPLSLVFLFGVVYEMVYFFK